MLAFFAIVFEAPAELVIKNGELSRSSFSPRLAIFLLLQV